MRQCSKCLILKNSSEFYNTKYRNQCKECARKWKNLNWQKHKEANLKRLKNYRLNNKEQISLKKKEWYQKNKDKVKKRVAKNSLERRKYDINFKISLNLRRRLNKCLKNKTNKIGSAIKDLGCNLSEYKLYLESKFQSGMTWDNYGREGWHIDHIEPLSSFDLSNRDNFLKAFHFTNTQPLWAKDNLKKSDNFFRG